MCLEKYVEGNEEKFSKKNNGNNKSKLNQLFVDCDK